MNKEFEWTARMCERIDQNQITIIGVPKFARRIEDLPKPLPINTKLLLKEVEVAYLTDIDAYLKQGIQNRSKVIFQMERCGFDVDIEAGNCVHFSRWIAPEKDGEKPYLQFVKFEFIYLQPFGSYDKKKKTQAKRKT